MLNCASYEVSILVNGNSVKTHFKDGKTYIEAKGGSEYEIHIKNNAVGRILVVASVDGLNVLTGESASTVDSGYVVNGYSKCKIKGFRYSDNKVGAFKFSKKNKSYAKSKHDGLESNCGIIGVAIYGETLPVQTWTISNYNNSMGYSQNDWTTYSTSIDKGVFYSTSITSTPSTSDTKVTLNASSVTNSTSDFSQHPRSVVLDFDMGTDWGKSKDSKVVDTEFNRGPLLATTDIYYASRDSLLNMGVIIQNTTQVSFPKSFIRYAKPPTDWVA